MSRNSKIIHGRRYALLIGINNYCKGYDPVFVPEDDVEKLERLLKDPNIGAFEVHKAEKKDFVSLRKTIRKFFKNRNTGDVVLLYFAGHGDIGEGGEFYFVAEDTDDVDSTGIEASYVFKQLESCKAQNQIIILDCCHSGEFTKLVGRGKEAQQAVQQLRGDNGRGIIASSKAYQLSREDPDIKYSVFSSKIIDGIKSGEADNSPADGKISVYELAKYVKDKMKGEKQTPIKAITGKGEIYIAYNPKYINIPEKGAEIPAISEFPKKEWGCWNTIYGHEDEVSSIQFMRPNYTTDPEILMSGSKDGKVKFWLIKNRRCMSTIDMHSPVNSIALYDNLLAVGTDNYCCLYDISGFKSMIRDFRSNEDYVPEKLIEHVIDFRSDQILKPIEKVSFSLGGRFIAIASKSRVLIFDKSVNGIIKEVDVKSYDINALEFIDGKANFALGYSSFVEVWSIVGNKPIKKFEPVKGSAKTVRSLAFNARSEVLLGILYTWSTEGSMVRLWNKHTNSVKVKEFKYWHLTSLSFTPDGKFLLLGGDNKQIIFWNLLNDNVKIFKGGSNDIMSISFHENYKSFATSIKGDNSIQIWIEFRPQPMEIKI